MLNLESSNLSLEKTLRELFTTEKSVSIDRIVSDFDNTLFHISTPDPAEKTKIVLSIFLKCYNDLVKYGDVDSYLRNAYNDSQWYTVLDQPEDGYNFSIFIDLQQISTTVLASPEEMESLIAKLSLLKRNALAAPFDVAFKRYDVLAQEAAVKNVDLYVPEENSEEATSVINYREDETIYIRPSHDRVTVIFTALFKDETDKIFGNVFLQEFVDARKRSIQNAPQVLFSPYEPPLELRGLPEFQNFNYGQQSATSKYDKGFVTFVLFPRHLVPQKRENTITQIQLFRTYFHYHIKASKAYLHSRMRKRVLEYLKILNRAKPDQEEKDIERKTASGRRFVQRI
ncbi:Arc35 protein [Saccharomycopsis crataegensis]|uniref:Arp2/3 complex 34 kDa subunit n=1 Tax=Saccharomycopsis crataegensis TaxID=43959 RepID=A0AAV5QI73_9ASCO|nr:Arc35 protein [Saccharomycopsis crataegensis]